MMLTTKTLGRDPGCAVMSISAVMFDPTGEDTDAVHRKENQIFTPISSFDSAANGMKSDPDTLRWWKKQPAWSTIGADCMDSNVSIEAACMLFQKFHEEQKPVKVWCNSPTFHVPIMAALFQKIGINLPFGYREEMDYRTALELAYGDREMRPQIESKHSFYRHHALGDAINQATALVRALQDIKNHPSPLLEKQRWLMLDIETLGRSPGHGIMSIGGSVFNSTNDLKIIGNPLNHFYRVLSTFDLTNNGFQTDPATLKWWREKEIWKNLSVQITNSNVGVRRVCEDFAHFIITQAKPDKIWANSPSFDIEMVRFMFKKMNVNFPINYQNEMDFRTLMELTYPKRENRPERAFSGMNLEHHALGDSIEQSLQATKALKKLGLAKDLCLLTSDDQKKMAGLVEKVELNQRDEENAKKATSFIKTLPKTQSKKTISP